MDFISFATASTSENFQQQHNHQYPLVPRFRNDKQHVIWISVKRGINLFLVYLHVSNMFFVT